MKALEPRVQELLTMLSYRRRAGSTSEAAFIDRFIRPLGVAEDNFGNLWKVIGNAPILWSSHTDSVHKEDGRQHIEFGDGIVTTTNSNCLGADDAVGVWIMMHMIRASIPGTYVFHREEEISGNGSAFIRDVTPERLSTIRTAIAFDRRGRGDIITHQLGRRSASKAFAKSVRSRLWPLAYQANHGLFTDTANYAGIVPECSNLSVGYFKEHTAGEYLDVEHACSLSDAVLAADWTNLPAPRPPAELSWKTLYGHPAHTPPRPVSAAQTLRDYVFDNPDEVADFLTENGFTLQDVDSWAWSRARAAA